MKEYQLWFSSKELTDTEFETFYEAICCLFEFRAGTKNSEKFVHLNMRRASRWRRYTWNSYLECSVFGILFYSETNIDVGAIR